MWRQVVCEENNGGLKISVIKLYRTIALRKQKSLKEEQQLKQIIVVQVKLIKVAHGIVWTIMNRFKTKHKLLFIFICNLGTHIWNDFKRVKTSTIWQKRLFFDVEEIETFWQ